ncbi:helix-turn-helix domain-containing protein [Thalassomonas actiniarum]|uniref:Helix-turn-helix domain-containing protein n=1 Tax=Thalassomonas actiniarum TaxID=485447 RepID=A0AAF0C383_9GAMM|nr:helix-turn-helix transcriptional regulator [Thalassomonas actiniarum]WDD98409.1 helix-turn-helix domain-containing protein [Thalassomonas actiniarum]
MQQRPMNLSPERIKYLRHDNGWSQELLAKASGLSLRTIQRAEKEGNSSLETQQAIAAALNVKQEELFAVSPTPNVNWKRTNMMQSFIALLVVAGAILMLFLLGGELKHFSDFYGGLFLALFMYACTAVAFGPHGLMKSIRGLRYLFASEISPSPASDYLSLIFKKQITFLYGGALIGLLTGSVAIHSHHGALDSDTSLHTAYAVNLLILLYGAIIAEAIFRPLAIKLESRELK